MSDVAAWMTVLLIACAAIAGFILRRFVRGPFVRRLRPHFMLGYAALIFGLIHVTLSMNDTRGTNGLGILFAGIATAGLTLQTLVGSNLQSPGAYRLTLRRWHLALLFAVIAFVVGHILFNAPFVPMPTID